MWSSNGEELNRTNGKTPIATTMENLLVYTGCYTISQLSTNDENRIYWCEVVINSRSPTTNNASVTLDVTGKILL